MAIEIMPARGIGESELGMGWEGGRVKFIVERERVERRGWIMDNWIIVEEREGGLTDKQSQ